MAMILNGDDVRKQPDYFFSSQIGPSFAPTCQNWWSAAVREASAAARANLLWLVCDTAALRKNFKY